jgi:hypothetical protein
MKNFNTLLDSQVSHTIPQFALAKAGIELGEHGRVLPGRRGALDLHTNCTASAADPGVGFGQAWKPRFPEWAYNSGR